MFARFISFGTFSAAGGLCKLASDAFFEAYSFALSSLMRQP